MSQPTELRPRRAWYLVALGTFVLLTVVGIVLGGVLLSMVSGGTNLQEFKRGSLVTEPSPIRVKLSSEETKVVYSTNEPPAAVICTKRSGPGELKLTRLTSSSTVTLNGTTWHGVSKIQATQSGTYSLSCRDVTGGRAAVGNHVGGVLGGVFGGIAAIVGFGLLGLVVGGVIAIVTLVRRSANKKKLLQPAGPVGYGYGPPPPPQSPPPPPRN